MHFCALAALGAVALCPPPSGPNQGEQAPALEFEHEDYLGYYGGTESAVYRAIVRDGDGIALEIPGTGVFALEHVDGDRWALAGDASIVLAFERSEGGDVVRVIAGERRDEKFEPSRELPAVEALAARVAKTHRLDLLETLGPLRIRGAYTVEPLGVEATLTHHYAWPDRFRMDSVAGDVFERLAFDGKRVWYQSDGESTKALEGQAAEIQRLDNLFAYLGDWKHWYPDLQVVQALEHKRGKLYLVRGGGLSIPAMTLYIHAENAAVLYVDSLIHVEQIGRMGQRRTYEDYRDVSGMLLPHRTRVVLADPEMDLTVEAIVTEIKLGVKPTEGLFQLEER